VEKKMEIDVPSYGWKYFEYSPSEWSKKLERVFAGIMDVTDDDCMLDVYASKGEKPPTLVDFDEALIGRITKRSDTHMLDLSKYADVKDKIWIGFYAYCAKDLPVQYSVA